MKNKPNPNPPLDGGSPATQQVNKVPGALLHVTTRAAWASAQTAGQLCPESLTSVGFIHLCVQTQLTGVLCRFFQGQSDLLLLSIDPALLDAPVRWEAADGDQFPHLYGPLPTTAVTYVRDISAIG